jgi:hypothetical protein
MKRNCLECAHALVLTEAVWCCLNSGAIDKYATNWCSHFMPREASCASCEFMRADHVCASMPSGDYGIIVQVSFGHCSLYVFKES